MPWVALYDGEKKGPRQVPEKTDAECPTCGGTLRIRKKGSDGTPRHFMHTRNLGGGGGGSQSPGSSQCESVAESDKHIKWKSIVADELETIFGSQAEQCVIEQRLAAPTSEKSHRDGDVVLTFSEFDEQLGNGVAVEVQHRNESKDKAAVARDYLRQNYAVVWTDESDFSNDRWTLEEIDVRFRAEDAAHWDVFSRGHVARGNTYRKLISGVRNNLFLGPDHVKGAPATIPPEYFIEITERTFREALPQLADDWTTAATDIQELHTDLSTEVSCTIPLKKWLAADSAALKLYVNREYSKSPIHRVKRKVEHPLATVHEDILSPVPLDVEDDDTSSTSDTDTQNGQEDDGLTAGKPFDGETYPMCGADIEIEEIDNGLVRRCTQSDHWFRQTIPSE